MDDEDWNFQKIDENKGKHGAQNALKNGKRFASNILCFIEGNYRANEITFGIYSAIKFDKAKRLKKIWVFLLKSNSLIELSREEILEGKFVKKFFLKTEEAT